jgi:putative hydrolase of the HAD superfamily
MNAAREKNIRAVTFDLWETLLFSKNGSDSQRTAVRCSRVAEAFGRLGVQVSVEQVDSAVKQVMSWLLGVWDGNEDVSHVEQLELLVRFVSGGSLVLKNEWVEHLSAAYIAPFFEVPPYLNPEAPKALEELASEGTRIGLVCNTGLTPGFALRRFLDSEGIFDYFDFLGFSDEIGFRKPDLRVFHFVARKLKVDPCSIVHVGDNLRLDVWGAKHAGLKAILYESEIGRDRIAEADPTSLVARSRSLGTLEEEDICPDKTITSLAAIKEALHQLEDAG